MELFSSLFFQEVQNLSPIQTALRFLPSVISGATLNILTGFYAHKFRADYLVSVTTLLSAVAPLLMALINPSDSYWYSAFWAMLVAPLSADGTSLLGPSIYKITIPILSPSAVGCGDFEIC